MKKFLTFCRIRRIPTDLLIQWPPNLATTASLIPRSWRRAVGRPHRSINSAHSIHISALFSFYSSRPHAPKGDDDLSSVADIQFGTRSYPPLPNPPLPRAVAIIAWFFYCANKTCSSDCSFANNLLAKLRLELPVDIGSHRSKPPHFTLHPSAKSAYAFPTRYFYFWSALKFHNGPPWRETSQQTHGIVARTLSRGAGCCR